MATRYALPLLRRTARGTASIILTSSVSGLVASPASPIYSATKGGAVLFMKAIAVALGPEGIRANAICPGPTDTPMLREFMAPLGTSAEHATTEEIQSMIVKYAKRFIPLQRPVDGGFVAR